MLWLGLYELEGALKELSSSERKKTAFFWYWKDYFSSKSLEIWDWRCLWL